MLAGCSSTPDTTHEQRIVQQVQQPSISRLICQLPVVLRHRTDEEASSLTTRQQVRQAIMQGRIQDAQALLHDNHADMLESVLHPNLDVVIFFHCLQYIELIR